MYEQVDHGTSLLYMLSYLYSKQCSEAWIRASDLFGSQMASYLNTISSGWEIPSVSGVRFPWIPPPHPARLQPIPHPRHHPLPLPTVVRNTRASFWSDWLSNGMLTPLARSRCMADTSPAKTGTLWVFFASKKWERTGKLKKRVINIVQDATESNLGSASTLRPQNHNRNCPYGWGWFFNVRSRETGYHSAFLQLYKVWFICVGEVPACCA